MRLVLAAVRRMGSPGYGDDVGAFRSSVVVVSVVVAVVVVVLVVVVVVGVAGPGEAVLLPTGDALTDRRAHLVGVAEVDPGPDARVDDLIDCLREGRVVAGDADGVGGSERDVVGAEEVLQRPGGRAAESR